MNSWSKQFTAALLLVAISTVAFGQFPLRRAADIVQIQLLPSPKITKSLVTIGDISRITGGPEYLRRRIAKIDVADLNPGQPESITAAQVRIRLLLAGIPTTTFELFGERARITSPLSRPATAAKTSEKTANASSVIFSEDWVTSQIRSALARELTLVPEDIELRFLQPLKISEKFHPAESSRVYLPARPRPGVLSITVSYHDENRKLLGSTRASVEFTQMTTVPVATRRIFAGDVFGPTNVRLERHRFQQGVDPADSTNLVGRKSLRSISAGRTIRTADVNRGQLPVKAARKPEPYIVRSRDVVELVAKKGGVRVSIPNAEVLSSARKGDLVRVRNPRSREIVTGRVVSSSRVEIRL